MIGSDPAVDSDADATTGETAAISLGIAEDNDSIDAGFYRPAIISNRVWNDLDGDGLQETGEPGIANVTVKLYNSLDLVNELRTTTTDANGIYFFDDLEAGNYVVEFVTPGTGWDATSQTAGSDTTIDSDAHITTGFTNAISLAAGDTNDTIDAGFFLPPSIGDFVWADYNNNGIQDSGEPGIDGVTVRLLNASTLAEVASTTTVTNSEGSGFYIFQGFPAANYTVEFVKPAGYNAVTQSAGGDTALDSDADPSTGRTGAIDATAGAMILDVDVGFFPPATISNFVWDDLDGDGIQDGSEVGIDGVIVRLIDPSDNSVITTDTTTGGGFYEFTDLLEGDYIVEFVTPTNYIASPQTSGLDNTVDSNIDTTTARTATIALRPGETNDTIDAGFYQPGTISDYVWNDLDADGVQDGGEPPLGNVTVRLLDAFNGNAVLETTTSHPTTGLYSFTNLGAATSRYIVAFVAPSGFTGSPVDQGGNDALDSDASTANGRTSTITLNAGQTIDSVDAGFFEPATISDYVWTDTNGDGVQDGSESGLDGVTVRLLHPTTFAVISTTTTSGGGAYSFTNVPAGSYVVEFATPSGLTGSPQDSSSTTDALDSDADPNSGRTSTITVAAGDTIDTIDAGFFSPGTIGNFVWEDTNGNGVQDLNEDGLDGINVNLLDPNNSFAVLETTTTASDGLYSFEDLNANDYVVEFVLPSGYARSPQANGGTSATDSGADKDTGRTSTITLAAGGTNEGIDAGLYQPATISDRVWNDLDADGIQDLDETSGIGGTQVNLYDDSNNLVDTVFTDSSGTYSFTGLAPGDYTVEFIPPSGYVISPQDTSGSTEAQDSDADPSTYLTDTITLASGDDVDTVDVGLSLPAVIGNYMWVDENADGVQDAGEPGIPGVTVQLYDATGSTLLQTTETDANGGYLFNELVTDTYIVRISTGSLPPSLAPNPTYDEDSGTTSPDSQTAVSLSPGDEHLSADFGYNHASVVETNDPSSATTPLGAIGDRIWSDDGDGIQEPGEPGIPNVPVLLQADTNGDGVYGGTGDLGQAVLTDASGNYIFDGLEPGAHRVQVSTASLPTGFTTTPTGDPEKDGDNINDPIVIAPGDVFLNADFGYNNPSSLTLGDKVYLDRDGDGTFDNDEHGIAGVTVALIVGADVVATTVTDDFGNYLFTGLQSGLDYTIRVTDTEHVLGSLVQTGDPDTPSSPNCQSTVTNLSASDLDQDFGYAPPAHRVGDGLIGDTVFLDFDNDGNVDAGEGLEGITVYLDADGNGSRGANERYVVTDENGHYYFGGLETAGTYTVAVDTSTLPSGLTNTVDPDTVGTGNHRSTVPLSLGGTDLDQDFGYLATIPNAISGTIWEDSDANGSLNESGMGIAGVTVDLYKDGQLVGTTSTDNNGGYSFGGLPEGDYVVDVTDTANLLDGYWHSEGPSPGNDGNSQTDTYSINKLTGGTTNSTADFGYYVKGAALGDFVWEDVNSDGEQNESGTGIANAVVTLRITYPNGTAITLVTETDGSGNYSFGNLLFDEDYRTATAGDNADPKYTITFNTPSGLTPTHPGAGTAETDSNGTTDSSITLEQGETDDTIDSGFAAPGSLAYIGDLVSNDANADGIKDGAESGLVGVTVNLYDDNGTLVDTDITDSSGAYFFGSLLAGDYTVEFVPPFGYLTSPQDVGAESTDSDADPITFRTASINLVASENEDEVDAGMYAPATIGNYVWVDENGDGPQDAGEPGIPGVTVDLYDGTTFVATTTTDALGGYLFTGIPAGTYEVRIDSSTLPTGLAANPTYNEDTGTTMPNHVSAVTVGAGATHLTADFGYNYASVADTDTPSTTATGAIGDRLWNDTDQDGIQDPGESGIEGVTVRLLVDTNGDGVYGGTSGEILATTATDASGNYIFDGLDEGAYVIEVVASSLPTGFSATPTGNPDGDGDNTSDPQVIAPGDVILTADFGYHLPTGLTIGDTVYLDEDGDSTFDSGELGIAGVTLALLENGELIATTITDTNGNYNFGGLPSGLTYTVMVTDTSDVLGSWVQNGDPDTPLAPDGQSTVAALSGNNLDQDFGYVPAGHGTSEGLIGDTVFLDVNGNGTPDTGEGIAGVRLYLDLNHDGSLDADEPSTITNENGTYAFGGLNPTGTYTVAVDSTTIDSGLTNTVDPDGSLANQSNVTLAGIDLDQDFGYAAGTPNSITGTVWTDTNADGVLLESSAGLPGITVALYSDPNGDGDPSDGVVIGMVTTDSHGDYTFGGLPDGDYIVDVVDTANLLEGYAHSIGPNAGDGTTDNQSQRDTYSITGLMGGTTDSTGDFGYYRDGAAIGNFVWDDTNSDGIQNESGTGFVGSLVTLTITYPNGDTVDVTTLTTAGGAYSFGNLLADEDYNTATAGSNADPSYTVTFSNPSGGFVPTQTGQGTTATDSNGSSESDITLAQGQTDDTIDSGFVGPASQVALGDRV